MKQLLYKYLTRIQIVLFICCIILAVAYPFKYIADINQILLLLFASVISFSLNGLLKRINKLKRIYIWLITLYILLICLQVGLMYILPKVTAYNDGAQIRNEAISLFYTGYFSGERYFLTYPNNINITLLLYGGYKILAPFSFYTVEHIIIMMSYHIMLGSILLLTYRYFNIYKVVQLLVLFIVTIPFHYYLFYFYTDTLVWWVPTLIVLLVGWQRETPNISNIRLLFITMLLVIGYLIKQNIILLLPALIIYLWFYGAWKKSLILLGSVIISLQLLIPSVHHLQEKYGFYQDDQYRFPYVHWIMMGISQSTFYNWKDYQYTYKQPTYEAKVSADIQEIKKRLFDRPLWQTLLVPFVSLDTTWSEGTLYAINSVRVNVEGNTTMWNWLFGNHKIPILYIIQAIYITVLLNLVSTLRHIKKIPLNLLLQITLLGVMTFHIFWESNPRYIVIWYPFILLLSIQHPVKIKWCYSPKIIYGISIILIAIIIRYTLQQPKLSINHDYYVKTGVENSAYATDYYLKQQSFIHQTTIVKQTFKMNKSFNFIDIVVDSPIESTYQIDLIDFSTGHKLWGKIITTQDLMYNPQLKTTQLNLSFDTINPYKDTVYQLIFTRLKGQWHFSLSPNRYIDSYQLGQVQLDNQLLSNQDLIFSVGEK